MSRRDEVARAVGDAAVGEDGETIERERRARAVADEALARGVVVGADRDGGVEVEAVDGDRMSAEVGWLVGVDAKGMSIDLVEEAALDRDVRAGVESGVGRIGRETIEAEPREETSHRSLHAGEDDEELAAGGRERRMEDGGAVVFAGEESFEDEHVEVDVQVQRAAEALDEGDGAGAAALRTGGAPEVAFDLAKEDAVDRGDHVGALGGEGAELEGDREDPLSDGYVGEHAIDEVRGGVGHGASRAGGAGAAFLTGEGDDAIVAAVVAAQTEEAVLGEAAPEVVLERALHVARERARVALVGVAKERGEVLAHDGVQHRSFGTVTLVRTTKRAGAIGQGTAAGARSVRGARALEMSDFRRLAERRIRRTAGGPPAATARGAWKRRTARATKPRTILVLAATLPFERRRRRSGVIESV